MTLSLQTLSKFGYTKLSKLLVFGFVQLLALGLILHTLRYTQIREESVLDAKVQYQNNMLKENVKRSLALMDNYLDDLKESVTKRLLYGELQGEEGFKAMKNLALKHVPMLSYITIYDVSGDLFATGLEYPIPKVNVVDRPYFKSAKEGIEKVYFGPYLSRASNILAFSSVRRLSFTNNEFSGIMVGVINLEYFSEFCNGIVVSEGYESYILNSNNEVIFQCGMNINNYEKMGKPFFEVISKTKFEERKFSDISYKYDSPEWTMVSSKINDVSDITVVTLVEKSVGYQSLSNLIWQNYLFLMVIGLTQAVSFLLYYKALIKNT